MGHLVTYFFVAFSLYCVCKWFAHALRDEPKKFDTKHKAKQTQQNEFETKPTAESIIASMYVYWKLRMKNSESEDEGVECFLSASKSEAQFRALIDKSMNIKTEEEQEAAAVAKSPNVLPLKFN
jgi:hypothetical protein